ncbi:type VI secretion system protein ImpG [Pseudomonas libanensis]|uniref:Type VI secretion protein n=1 Tax=Pseudomonas libanensis TaxID=75588 RepID=A0A0R2Y0M3_9PSED|nr:type VI secretion system baseplate subunit TssF [Pseudomonas libanensis]KRP41911.1 type VI secretion protein [Pseudomonas libanensis]SDK61313.1 type VI secretion system protein ImpG [Pseudomonas libanensis]
MTINRYFQHELSALRQLGRRFAERNPALAPFLAEAGQDPDVERLLEGFAFLTGRLRQKLDDELPELTHSLMHLLWPNYMRPIPAFSILQFDPLKRAGPSVRVARDTAVESTPIEGERCRFRTCYDTDVMPLQLSGLEYRCQGEGAWLDLCLTMSAEGSFNDLAFDSLRLHLAGDHYVSQGLYLGLLRHLDGIQVLLSGHDGLPLNTADGHPVTLRLSADQVQPVGFAPEQALMPYPQNTFGGYRHLQEYFAFPEKYLFVDVEGLNVLHTLPCELLKQAQGMVVRFQLHTQGRDDLRPSLDNVKLYCTPIVNLFNQDAIPIRLDAKQDEYLLMPGGYAPGHASVFSVDRVTGWRPGGLGHQTYVPFESFEHDARHESLAAPPSYSIRQRSSVQHGGLDTWMGFGTRRAQGQETLSVELTCTNSNLAQQVRPGEINQPGEQAPESLTFHNITTPTASFTPPLEQDFLWRLISNMSLNYLSLTDINALKVVLETYDLPRYHDRQALKVSQKRLGALRSIRHEAVDRLHRGLPIRGLRIDLTVDPQGFVGQGDLFLFASVINQFFALYANLNSYHELRVLSTQGDVYLWPSRTGQQPLL